MGGRRKIGQVFKNLLKNILRSKISYGAHSASTFYYKMS
jgi:hypothetical protein